MKKLFLFLVVGLFMLSTVSAWSFDNWKFERSITFDGKQVSGNYLLEKYKPIEIKNAFGLGNIIFEGYISQHTDVCGINCSSIIEINLHEKRPLIDNVDFYTIQEDGSRIKQDVRSYQFNIKINETEYSVDDYEVQCSGDGKFSPNGTEGTVCLNVKVGSHLETEILWKEYTLGTSMPEGIYTVKLAAEKKPSRRVDWIIKTGGETLNEWAVWNATLLDVGLIVYYNLNELAGPVIDIMDNHNGTNFGATAGVPGKIGTAYKFADTSSQHIVIPDDNDFDTADLTISWWMNVTVFSTRAPISKNSGIGGDRSWGASVQQAGNYFFEIRNSGDTAYSVSNSFGHTINEWHLHTITYDGDDLKYYIDGGNVQTNPAATGSIDFSTVDIWIGSGVDSSSNTFGGLMDEIGIWNRSLSPAEVSLLWNDGKGITPLGFIEIILNSPVDDSLSITNLITFNATATILSDATLANMSLFTNETGDWIRYNITTGLSGTTSTQTWNRTISDGGIIWNVQSCNSDGDCIFSLSNNTLKINTIAPSINLESPEGIIDFGAIGRNETLNVTFTDSGLDTCWYNYNGINITIDGCLTGIKNSSKFVLELDNTNMTIYVNNTGGLENSTFVSWNYRILENSRTFNNVTFETATETFSINISANSSLSSVKLVYEGVEKTAITSGNISTVTFDIPLISTTKTFNWSFTYASQTIVSTSSTQVVSPIVLGFCNATLTVPYINFTFKNETTAQESLNATIDSSWNIWLGSGTVKKSFSLVDNTENENYGVCFNPSNRTLNANVTLTYNNAQSQQRAFVSEPVLTNISTTQTLYLLPTNLGLFGQFQTRDIASNPIPLVKGLISRTIGISTVTVASSLTDSSGLVIFFLNPDVTYDALFSKTGFANNLFTFVPTTDIRIITMGGTTTVEGSNISLSTNYVITPSNSSLINNTIVDFGFNVSGNTAINFISMNITDGNGTSFGFTSNAGLGFITLAINTSNNKTIIGIYKITTATETITVSKIWNIGEEFEGDYSLFKQGKLWFKYGFSEFSRLLIVILIMSAVMIFLSKNELADNNESKIAVIVLMMWGFSAIGWLNNPAVVGDTGISIMARQFGIAILSTIVGLFFILRRLFV